MLQATNTWPLYLVTLPLLVIWAPIYLAETHA